MTPGQQLALAALAVVAVLAAVGAKLIADLGRAALLSERQERARLLRQEAKDLLDHLEKPE